MKEVLRHEIVQRQQQVQSLRAIARDLGDRPPHRGPRVPAGPGPTRRPGPQHNPTPRAAEQTRRLSASASGTAGTLPQYHQPAAL
jgi:hypothetical protein